MSEKEMTAPVVSVGADTEQSSQNLIDNSLTDFDPNFKRFDAEKIPANDGPDLPENRVNV